MHSTLEVKNISKGYHNHMVISDIAFTLHKGEIGCFLGPSGSGKTTLLRTIAGFEEVLSGEIWVGGSRVASRGFSVPPEKRHIGMLFQDYALFPHMTVFENVGFGVRSMKDLQKKTYIMDQLSTVGLEGVARKYPHELSGGQQQRAALARALAPRPRLLLLDEPFSNLDVALRERLSMDVREIIKEQRATALMVTHNQQEAFAMADRIGVISDGSLQQWDDAHAIYHRPANGSVAAFVGEGALLPGTVIDSRRVECGLGILEGSFSSPCPIGCSVDILIRPEDVIHEDDSPFKAMIIHKTFRGPNILYTLSLRNGDSVLALVPSHHQHRIGQEIGIRPQVEDIVLYARGEVCLTEMPDPNERHKFQVHC
ncbi:MAG: ABC transporter ATP-binding protein [Deltaproteobacteria bacterium]|nr:MAG: ABC transporter ATP-binding protein [Deltaproteobacteria bacterium]